MARAERERETKICNIVSHHKNKYWPRIAELVSQKEKMIKKVIFLFQNLYSQELKILFFYIRSLSPDKYQPCFLMKDVFI